MEGPLRYWVHLLVEFDPITTESRIVKGYCSWVKEEKKEEDTSLSIFNQIKKEGDIEL